MTDDPNSLIARDRAQRSDARAILHHSTRPATDPYEPQELIDLGVRPEDLAFGPDMTFQDFQRAEESFRDALPKRQVTWLSTPQTRARAQTTIRDTHAPEHLDYCEQLLAWAKLPAPTSANQTLSLEWLFVAPQLEVDAWRHIHPKNALILQALEEWIDDPNTRLAEHILSSDLIRDRLEASIRELPEREQAVLTLRFGLDGDGPRKLETVGKSLRVTRERVRQIESKALRRLHHPSRRPPESLSLSILANLIKTPWPAASAACNAAESLHLLKSRLTPLGRLFLATHPPKQQAIIANQSGAHYAGRFLLMPNASPRIAQIAQALDRHTSEAQHQYPVHLPQLVQQCHELTSCTLEEMQAALTLARNITLYAGYAVSAPTPRAELDAAELHNRMLTAGGHVDRTFLGRTDPKSVEHTSRGDLSRRDHSASMAHPHLFMKLGDETWLALHDRLDLRNISPPTRGIGHHSFRARGVTRIGEIRDAIQELGIAKLATLRNRLSHIPEGSINGLIQSRGDFERIAPGTYCLTDTPIEGHETQLLDSWHIRHYLLARKCGERLSTYRAWTPRLEYNWCKWARAHDTRNYPELLYFAEPHQWPLEPSDLRFWTHEKHLNARRPMPPRIKPKGRPRLPDPTEILELLALHHTLSGLNPLRVNRSLGSRPRIATNWAHLALLTAAGWLEDADHYFTWHGASDTTSELINLEQCLLSERIRIGYNNPDSPTYQQIRDLATEGLHRGRCSWLHKDQRKLLADMLTSTAQGHERHATASDTPLDLEDALGQLRAERALRRLQD